MELAVAAVGVFLAVIGWLLADKDAKQGKQIDVLFRKHDEDAKALQDLKVEIAKEHYLKHELDQRFQQLDATFREGFEGLRSEFRELARVLIDHITKENRG